MDDFLQVNSGAKKVSIKNELGQEVGVYYFNPNDIGIIDRFDEANERFEEVMRPLKALTNDSTEEEQIEAFKSAKEELFKMCDYLFGGNMSEAFFGSVDPFSPVDGSFYCENALNAVSAYISKQFGKETKKINDRVEKYTHGYRTGKHKDGR